MPPLLQQLLESKNERRKRLMALPYPEKVRIVEKMREAAREIQLAQARAIALREDAPAYEQKKGQPIIPDAH